MVIYYSVIVAAGIIYALIVTGSKEKKSLAVKYPLLAVFSFFILLSVAYYLLITADKSVMDTYFGFLTAVITFFVTKWCYLFILKHGKN